MLLLCNIHSDYSFAMLEQVFKILEPYDISHTHFEAFKKWHISEISAKIDFLAVFRSEISFRYQFGEVTRTVCV